ncbi:MAG: phage tail tape measure protein [Janthinobacterium lividum]
MTTTVAAYVAFDQLVKKAGDFQDAAEKTGDSAANIASLAVAAGTAGAGMDTIVGAASRLTQSLVGVDDDSKKAGAAVSALGLNLEDFKELKTADQLEQIGKALNEFEDGPKKAAVAMALFGRAGAELLPFLKELGSEGARQNILTEEQITLADEYADNQAKLHAQIGLYSAAIATQMLPAYNDLKSSFLDMIKDIAGVKDGVKGLGNEKGIQTFADGAVTSLAFVIDAVDGVYRTVQVAGTAIGGVAAAAVAVASGEFKNAKNIMSSIDDEVASILNRATLGARLADKIASRKPAADDQDDRKTLNFDGADKKSKVKDTAAQEAKAQLAFDLDQIKKGSDAEIGIYTNAEKIMEAKHSAQLIEDADYYKKKTEFILLYGQAQEASLLDQIDRAKQEDLTGKAKIDNDRKVLDLEGQLAKVRADTDTKLTVNGVQAAASNTKIEKSYIGARTAAESYIATIEKQYAAEIAGIGQGNDARAKRAAINQIEDKYQAQRETLANDKLKNQISDAEYDKQLALINEFQGKATKSYLDYYDKLSFAQKDWVNGANEAVANYADNASNVAKSAEGVFNDAFKSMEDALVNFATTGKLSFADFTKSIIAGIVRIQAQAAIASASKGLGGLLGSLVGAYKLSSTAGGSVTGDTGSDFASGFTASAAGGYDIPSGVNPVTQLHEREMVLPAAQADVIRSMANGGGGAGFTVTINNTASDKVQAQVSPGADGGLEVMISAIENQMATNVAYGMGPLNAAMQGRYGLKAT